MGKKRFKSDLSYSYAAIIEPQSKGEVKMKNYVISYTLDFCQTVETLTIRAIDYTKAYLAAIAELPLDVAILEAKEQVTTQSI